ncbi:MAG: hypothetical protein V5A64_00270 [Candidatus Thermoplasmatota archaeon]
MIKNKEIIGPLIMTFLLISLFCIMPVSSEKEKNFKKEELNNSGIFDKLSVFCKINSSGKARIVTGGEGYPSKNSSLTILIDIDCSGEESYGETNITPMLGYAPWNKKINGSHRLIIWGFWGDFQRENLETSSGPVDYTLNGKALFVQII